MDVFQFSFVVVHVLIIISVVALCFWACFAPISGIASPTISEEPKKENGDINDSSAKGARDREVQQKKDQEKGENKKREKAKHHKTDSFEISSSAFSSSVSSTREGQKAPKTTAMVQFVPSAENAEASKRLHALCEGLQKPAASEVAKLVNEGADVMFSDPSKKNTAYSGVPVMHILVKRRLHSCFAACLKTPRAVDLNARDAVQGNTLLHEIGYLTSGTDMFSFIVALCSRVAVTQEVLDRTATNKGNMTFRDLLDKQCSYDEIQRVETILQKMDKMRRKKS